MRFGDVGELQFRGDIYNRIEAGNVGAHAVVDGDRAPLSEVNSGVLKPEPGYVGGEARDG